MRKQLSSMLLAAATGFFTLGLVSTTNAADPTGVWKWSTPGRDGGQGREYTLTLKVQGDQLTGTMSTPGRAGGQAVETAISEGKVKGDDISFTVTREFGGNKMVLKYSAKVSGDTLKGKIESERGGQTRSRDWEAKKG